MLIPIAIPHCYSTTSLSPRLAQEVQIKQCRLHLAKMGGNAIAVSLIVSLHLQFGQIHFAIWTNTVCNLDKYYGNGFCRVAMLALSFSVELSQG